MTARRGMIYTIHHPDPETLLVVSGNMYNGLVDHPWVLAMTIIDTPRGAAPPFFVSVASGRCVEVDTLARYPKRLLRPVDGPGVAIQILTDIDNAVFKILATH